MNFWHRLKIWEQNLERAPRTQVLRTLILFFTVSAVVGVAVSMQVTNLQMQVLAKIEKDIKETEKIRMDNRLEILKLLKYERKITE